MLFSLRRAKWPKVVRTGATRYLTESKCVLLSEIKSSVKKLRRGFSGRCRPSRARWDQLSVGSELEPGDGWSVVSRIAVLQFMHRKVSNVGRLSCDLLACMAMPQTGQ
jgi:hypothetical protein